MENPQRYTSKVLELNELSPNSYELILDRMGLAFLPGQEIMLHDENPHHDRQYSIASGAEEECLRIVFRLIPEGELTPRLIQKKPGDPIEFTGAFGSFILRDPLEPCWFIATGTGIAPAICFKKTYPDLPMTVLHGVRKEADLYFRTLFEQAQHYYPCVSRESNTDVYQGRVTDLLQNLPIPETGAFYLCGANPMILDVRRLLMEKGVEETRIHSEAYYFW